MCAGLQLSLQFSSHAYMTHMNEDIFREETSSRR